MVTRTTKRLGERRNQCPSCGELFNSNGAFDKHRFGPFTDRQCMTPEGMVLAGMSQNSDGFWIGEKWERV